MEQNVDGQSDNDTNINVNDTETNDSTQDISNNIEENPKNDDDHSNGIAEESIESEPVYKYCNTDVNVMETSTNDTEEVENDRNNCTKTIALSVESGNAEEIEVIEEFDGCNDQSDERDANVRSTIEHRVGGAYPINAERMERINVYTPGIIGSTSTNDVAGNTEDSSDDANHGTSNSDIADDMEAEEDEENETNTNDDSVQNNGNEDIELDNEEDMVSCPICIEELRDPVVTMCGHLFCNRCIRRWLRRSKTCPTCSSSLPGDCLRRIKDQGLPEDRPEQDDSYGCGRLLLKAVGSLFSKETLCFTASLLFVFCSVTTY